MSLEFRFIEFNDRRWLRGADAARVAVIEDGEEDWLWMSKRDISLNIKEFGPHIELVKAQLAYSGK
jgi:hypothetical protein